jgi:hypothetical protein
MTELSEGKVMARKQKDEGVSPTNGEILPPARHVAPMRTPADVTAERKRLYRAAINGRVTVEEAAKLSFMLTGIRADLEADRPPQLEQIRGPCVDTIIINGVPSGDFLPKEEIDRLKSQFIEAPPAHIAGGPPMLKVFDGDAVEPEPDSEPSSAA